MKSCLILLLSVVCHWGFCLQGAVPAFDDTRADSVWVSETRQLIEALVGEIRIAYRPIPVSTSPDDYGLSEVCYDMIFKALSELGIEDRDTQAWADERKRIARWDARFFGDGFTLVPRDTIQAILKDRLIGWLRFYERIGRGYMSFSVPVFFNDYQYALLYAGESCGFLCGYGAWYVLKREDDQWVIVNKDCYWMS